MTGAHETAPRAWVGTRGWRHRHWRGPLYPSGLRDDAMLGYYAERFGCVEVDASAHGLPDGHTIRAWAEQVPRDFRFCITAPRALTHVKKLKNCEHLVQALLTRLALFGERLGPVLFRLPGRWRLNLARLEGFLTALPEHGRFVLEFGDPSWHCEAAYDLLRAHGAAGCLVGRDGPRVNPPAGDGFVYVRLGGPADDDPGAPVRGYRAETLRGWAGRVHGWSREGLDAYLVLDDDARGHAPRNARRLLGFMAEGAALPGESVEG